MWHSSASCAVKGWARILKNAFQKSTTNAAKRRGRLRPISRSGRTSIRYNHKAVHGAVEVSSTEKAARRRRSRRRQHGEAVHKEGSTEKPFTKKAARRSLFLESIIYRLRNTLNGNRPSWSFDPGPAQPPRHGEAVHKEGSTEKPFTKKAGC